MGFQDELGSAAQYFAQRDTICLDKPYTSAGWLASELSVKNATMWKVLNDYIFSVASLLQDSMFIYIHATHMFLFVYILH